MERLLVGMNLKNYQGMDDILALSVLVGKSEISTQSLV